MGIRVMVRDNEPVEKALRRLKRHPEKRFGDVIVNDMKAVTEEDIKELVESDDT